MYKRQVLERHHLLLKTNSILIFSGSVELDNYRSKELNRRMYKMKVATISSIESQMTQESRAIIIDARNLSNESIQASMRDLRNLNGDFWQHGNCKVHLKILHQESEAIIELGDEFMLIPSNENIKLLQGLFGDGSITIN